MEKGNKMKKMLRNFIFYLLVKTKIFPSKYFIKNPFKIVEFNTLIGLTDLNKNDVVLDIGCGSGLQTLLLGLKVKKVIGVDIDEKSIVFDNRMMKYIGKRIDAEFLCTYLEKHLFSNNYFDKVFSFSVIEHIPNYYEVLEKVYSILKPDGELIFSTDALEQIDPQIKNKHQEDHWVQKYFTENEIFNLLQKVGFNEIKIAKLFKSIYARTLFEQSIVDSFQFSYLKAVLKAIKLQNEEQKSIDNSGIFLIIKCKK